MNVICISVEGCLLRRILRRRIKRRRIKRCRIKRCRIKRRRVSALNVAYIISEYNPLHNGHVYHINETREALSPDAVVCVMSGNFTQRGSPTLVDKWARAEMALLSGVDLVVELHAVYATSSAEFFAHGALNVINAFNTGGFLSFGAESTDLELMFELEKLFEDESGEFKETIASNLKLGFPFAKARALAAERCYYSKHPENRGMVNITEFLKASNNILALEYVKAIKKTSSIIKPHTVKRTINSHNDSSMSGQISSATAIRKRIFEKVVIDDVVLESIPDCTEKILHNEILSGRGFVFDSDFFFPLLIILRRMKADDLELYPDASDGLAERIIAAAGESASYERLMEAAVTKRYPAARIRRILTHVLLNIKKNDLYEMEFLECCPYIKVLGFTNVGRDLLASVKKTALSPIITNYSSVKRINDMRLQRFVDMEIRATDIYSAMYKDPMQRKCGREFTHGIIMKSS